MDKFHDLLFFDRSSHDRKQGGDTAIDEYCLFLSCHLNVQVRITFLIIIIKFYKVIYHPVV